MGFSTINDIIDVPFVDDFLDSEKFLFGEKHFVCPGEFWFLDTGSSLFWLQTSLITVLFF
jgi:hypothetical protein